MQHNYIHIDVMKIVNEDKDRIIIIIFLTLHLIHIMQMMVQKPVLTTFFNVIKTNCILFIFKVIRVRDVIVFVYLFYYIYIYIYMIIIPGILLYYEYNQLNNNDNHS